MSPATEGQGSSMSLDILSAIPPTPTLPSARNLSPTVEHVDDHEPEFPWYASSSIYSSATSSRSSILLPYAEDDVEDVIARSQPLARRDFVNEMATSLWGLVGPKNFDVVMPGVFRSSFPKPENFNFLRTLGIRTILTLVPGPLPAPYRQFIDRNGIHHFQICIEPNKSPFITISQCSIAAALGVVLNRANHPILVHCNKGKHRTGCVIGCLRKVMGWDLEDIHSEYRKYAAEKARPLDERFIELFDEQSMSWLARVNYMGPVSEPLHDSPLSSFPGAANPSPNSTRLRS